METTLQLDSVSWSAFLDGSLNGTITDTEMQIISIILEQDVVSYCSELGSYTFDYSDIIEV